MSIVHENQPYAHSGQATVGFGRPVHISYFATTQTEWSHWHSIELLEHWLVEVDTDPNLRECMVEYARGRGGRTMTELCRGMGNMYQRVAEEQDAIGWRSFMEGMIFRGLRGLLL
jgi:hypothetical protein